MASNTITTADYEKEFQARHVNLATMDRDGGAEIFFLC